jgi:hypothetical protein
MYRPKKSPFQKRESLIGAVSVGIFVLVGVIMIGQFAFFGWVTMHPQEAAQAAGEVTKTFLQSSGLDDGIHITIEER